MFKKNLLSDKDIKTWENLTKTVDFKVRNKLTNSNTIKKIKKSKINDIKICKDSKRQDFITDNVETKFLNKMISNDIRIDKKKLILLKKGKIKPEKILDLHGFNSLEAKYKSIEFTKQNFFLGIRLVLIITGKGSYRYNNNEKSQILKEGILRKSLKSWLYESDIGSNILGIISAHKSHGGDGAFYIYLKRNKKL